MHRIKLSHLVYECITVDYLRLNTQIVDGSEKASRDKVRKNVAVYRAPRSVARLNYNTGIWATSNALKLTADLRIVYNWGKRRREGN